MDDNQLIEIVAKLWYSGGEDAESFEESWKRIKDRIYELELYK